MSFRISLAQLNPTVASFKQNKILILDAIAKAKKDNADMIVFPELMTTGYPPEDLLYRPSFLKKSQHLIEDIAKSITDICVVIGAPIQAKKELAKSNSIYPQIQNGAYVIQHGEITHSYAKQHLPNYRVFDEKRYFIEGNESLVVDVKGKTSTKKIGILICEDIWMTQPIKDAKIAGAEHIVVLNASPFRANKTYERLQLLEKRSKKNQLGITYVNLVGGQDELVFDGASIVSNANGEITFQAPQFESGVFTINIDESQPIVIQENAINENHANKKIYDALVLGLKDYASKNGFKGALLGLSGGIDSGLTLAIAVDALGAENVEAIMMPFRYTSSMSIEDAKAQANALGVKYRQIPIENMFNSFMEPLSEAFEGLEKDTTEENIQARSRGVILMAMSNKLGKMLLATGNKSEMSVGYATLYGDMAGGFSPLKDVLKTRVYALANYRNSLCAQEDKDANKLAIPERVITRPPSAELAPDQKDEDSLPPYDILDPILQMFIEEFKSTDEIVAAGYDKETVMYVANLVLLNEYKRRQSAPGIRITKRAFGKDRRYPITSHYRYHLEG